MGEYSNELYIEPSKELLYLTEEIFQRKNQDLKKACVWTTDALYHEYTEKMKSWKERGAECVNLETGTFYAVSKELDIKSIYFGFILDLIHTEKWTGWGGLDDELKSKVDNTKSNLMIIEDLAVELAKEIKQSYAFNL